MMFEVATPSTLAHAAQYLSGNDAVLNSVIVRAGVASITPHNNYYQELVEAIISQQLSVKAAATILKRFIALFPRERFPTPSQIIAADIDRLRSAGLSRQKIGYISDLATKVLDGNIRFDHLDLLPNEEIVAELTQVKGVGAWTVHMFLIFCMGRLDVLPVGDLGVRNGIQKLYALDHPVTAEDVRHIADTNSWHPYESVASWYIWHSLDNKPTL